MINEAKLILNMLKKDLLFYQNYNLENINFFQLIKALYLSRDFRLNLFVRLLKFDYFFIGKISEKIIFYLYGSTISKKAVLNCRLRFVHARSLIIGGHVRINSGFAYFFNNVTLGKLVPGQPSVLSSMPHFEGNCVFGTGSTILGSLKASKNIVFSAGCICTSIRIPPNTTILGNNKFIKGVFFKVDANNITKSFPSVF